MGLQPFIKSLTGQRIRYITLP